MGYTPPFYRNLSVTRRNENLRFRQFDDRLRALEIHTPSQAQDLLTLSVSPVTPTGLGQHENLIVWLDSSNDQSLTAGVDGEHVALWRDLSGFDNHFGQLVASAQPVRREVNGKPVLHFDGVDDYMLCSSTASLSERTGATCYAVVRYTGSSLGNYLVMSGGKGRSPRWPRIQQYHTGGFYRWLTGASDVRGRAIWTYSTTTPVQNDEWVVFVSRFDGAQDPADRLRIFLDGVRQEMGAATRTPYPTTQEVSSIVLGEWVGDNYNWEGDIAEIGIFDTAHDDATIETFTTQLRTKWEI